MPSKKTLYVPGQNEPFELSRSKVDLFLQCPRCFYIDRSEKYRISRPSGPMSYIPTALDILLKNEFDKNRSSQTVHPYCKDHDIDLIPFQHEEIKDWQNNRKGIRYHDPDTNFILYGAIDDCWTDNNGKLFVADYKTTTVSYDKKTNEPLAASLDEKGAAHKYWYKKQVEFYQWLFTKKDFNVSTTAYFVFCSAFYKDIENFNEELKFKIEILSYEGNYSWVDNTIMEIRKTLDSDEVPKSNPNCKHCIYRSSDI